MSNIITAEQFRNMNPNKRKYILSELRLKYKPVAKRLRTTKGNISHAVNDKNQELLERLAALVERESAKKESTVN